MRQVGLTDISVDYSSPAVRKRRIWGALVPYDKPWRTGANASTKVTFSKDVSIGGKTVPAGSYALLTIPGGEGLDGDPEQEHRPGRQHGPLQARGRRGRG